VVERHREREGERRGRRPRAGSSSRRRSTSIAWRGDADDRAAFVVEDGAYVSARWPGDAYLFARKLLERL
jgi:hypothetical protein